MSSLTPPAAPRPRLPAWAVAEGPFGIRLVDLAIVHLVIVAIELNVIVGNGPGAVPLDLRAHLLGAALALPILFRHRWPFQVLLASAVLMFFYYIFDRRNISPAPAFFVPFYDAAVAGYVAWGAAIGTFFMVVGLFVVELSTRQGLASLATDFLPQIAILALALALGEVVRSRRALAAETAARLRLAEEERAAEAGRMVAEERLRIARELHDTVAHSMATITVQAGSALHLLTGSGQTGGPNDPGFRRSTAACPAGADAEPLRAALTAFRQTSKGALTEMRSVLGQLRRADRAEAGAPDVGPGLSRLPTLLEAVAAAGAAVTVATEGEPWVLPGEADHAAYRILQESLTNVLRHAGPGAAAEICLCYQPEALTITVTDHGSAAAPDGAPLSADRGAVPEAADVPERTSVPEATDVPEGTGSGGHGIRGMRERAVSAGGHLTAGPLPGGGFRVTATLPAPAYSAGDTAAARGASS